MANHQRITKEHVVNPASKLPKPTAADTASRSLIRSPVDSMQTVTANLKHHSHADIFTLQRTLGNRTVGALLGGSAPHLPVIQAKLGINKAYSKYEMESDRVTSQNHPLPDHLKSGIEALSGLSMDDVKVHYNSTKPAQINALAYTQGTDIHLASGQEKHLPHETWHVVQQAQGRVNPTMQIKGKVNVNDDASLEKEADLMSAKVLQVLTPSPGAMESPHQRAPSLQPKSESRDPTKEEGEKDIQLRHVEGIATPTQTVQRFLDPNNTWKENEDPPVGIPARRRKKGVIEITRDGGQTWEQWDGKNISPKSIPVYPKGAKRPETAPKKTEKVTNVVPKEVLETPQVVKSIREVKPYDRKELVKTSLEHISTYLSPIENSRFTAALASSHTGTEDPNNFLKKMGDEEAVAEIRKQATAFLKSLSPLDLFSLRKLSKSNRQFVDEIIWSNMTIEGFSSFSGKMMEQAKGIVDETAEFIKIASDQVDIQVVEDLLNKNPDLRKIVKINYGQNLENEKRMGAEGVQLDNVEKTLGPTDDKNSKMHNKFMVQGGKPKLPGANPKAETVTTGSSNMTFSGQNLNTESVVSIKNPLVAAYFNHYFGMIRGRVKENDPQGQEFTKHLETLNQEGNPVRMAMEPFLDINAFVESELQGADKVVARMFVIDQNGRAVDALCRLAKNGVDVTMVVDFKQYDTFIRNPELPKKYYKNPMQMPEGERLYYVRNAIKKLKNAGVKVFKQKTPKEDKIMHDKMILAHFPETDDFYERETVMIGSSGFTKNVMEHKNYENMIAIDDKKLYEYFMKEHHNKSMNIKKLNTKM